MTTREEILANLLNKLVHEKLDKLEQNKARRENDMNIVKEYEKSINENIEFCTVRIDKIKEEAAQKAAKEEEAKARAKTPAKEGNGKKTLTEKPSTIRSQTPGKKPATSTSKTPLKNPEKSTTTIKASVSVKKIETKKPTDVGAQKTSSTKATLTKTPTSKDPINKSKIMASKSLIKTPNSKSVSKIDTKKQNNKSAPKKEAKTDRSETKLPTDNNIAVVKTEVSEEKSLFDGLTEPSMFFPKTSMIINPSKFPNFSSIEMDNTNNLTKVEEKKEEEPEHKPEPVAPVVLPRVKPDYMKVFRNHWLEKGKFGNLFNISELRNFGKINKELRSLSVKAIVEHYQAGQKILEEKILAQRERAQNPVTEFPPFALSRGAVKAIELLNDGVHLSFYTSAVYPSSDDIIFPYRIFFQLLNDEGMKNIVSDKDFWTESCKFLSNVPDGKIGTYINDIVKDFDFSDENIYKISQMVGPNASKLTPSYFSKLCGTTGFILFLIKDSLEYAGVIVDKKPNHSRVLKNLLYQQKKEQDKINQLNEFLRKS